MYSFHNFLCSVTAFKEYKDDKCTEVLQESPPSNHEDTVGNKNGFVLGVLRAYSSHHNLVLRPDDVWLAIMVQFGLYVHGHADTLLATLVKHKYGQKTLQVKTNGTLRTVEYGHLLKQFVGLMEEHLVDPSLGDWILPAFTTTTDHDRIVGSVVMMASLKAYFKYNILLLCGIPEVTLLGSVRDWESVRARIDGLLPFGREMKMWVDLLVPVLDQFVAAANGNVDRNFWRQSCHSCAKRKSIPLTKHDHHIAPKDQLSEYPVLEVDDVAPDYLTVDVEINDVAPGYLTVDGEINDDGVKYDTLLFAGHTSFEVISRNTIAPQLTWALALKRCKN
ncbi:Aste57867_4747 [Aphanomyces stellatus]|uniref:Aste57867_4747 protein n=1 Tax=Aphanomyces stellatus TaxID=120398 RepID=A0A485KFW2_9STRA|nr:hypothetical protein As57867_004734 [Aphanomyces stellatus]VFT81843.1 Aste57867_4747 [Aphanomyces stellatus]